MQKPSNDCHCDECANSFAEMTRWVVSQEEDDGIGNGAYLVQASHRFVTGAPQLRYPLVMALVFGDRLRYLRWCTIAELIDVQLRQDNQDPGKRTGDLRVLAGISECHFDGCSLSLSSFPMVTTRWRWVQESKYGQFKDISSLSHVKTIMFHRSAVHVDIDEDRSCEFYGTRNFSNDVFFFEVQLLCPFPLDYSGIVIYIGIARKVKETKNTQGEKQISWQTYLLQNLGCLVTQTSHARVFTVHSNRKSCPVLQPGDRIGVLYDGSNDTIRFSVNDVSYGVQFSNVSWPLPTQYHGQALPFRPRVYPASSSRNVELYPYVRVASRAVSFSVQKQRTLSKTLFTMCRSSIVDCIADCYKTYRGLPGIEIGQEELKARIEALPLPPSIIKFLSELI